MVSLPRRVELSTRQWEPVRIDSNVLELDHVVMLLQQDEAELPLPTISPRIDWITFVWTGKLVVVLLLLCHLVFDRTTVQNGDVVNLYSHRGILDNSSTGVVAACHEPDFQSIPVSSRRRIVRGADPGG